MRSSFAHLCCNVHERPTTFGAALSCGVPSEIADPHFKRREPTLTAIASVGDHDVTHSRCIWHLLTTKGRDGMGDWRMCARHGVGGERESLGSESVGGVG